MWRFVFASCAFLSDAAVLDGLFEDLASQFSEMPSSVVEGAIASSLGKSLNLEGVPSSDVTCVRDYSAACPEGWADHGDGETCAAPMYDQGPCPKTLSFGSLTPAEKRAKALACGYEFPCEVAVSSRKQRAVVSDVGNRNGCSPDLSATCPDDWTIVGVQCVGPVDYQGPCATMIDLSGLTIDQKAAYAKACATPWPCFADGFLERGASFLQHALQDGAASESQRFIVDSKLRVSQLNMAKKEVSKLIPRVKAGGRKATKALARLVSLTTDPDAKSVMISAGVVAAAETLMKRPDTSDRNVGLAGSLLTMLSGMPVAVEVSDMAGANGHVDIIIPRPSRVYQPDEVILQRSSGVNSK
jgi:CPW-WPC domain-containing protein